VKLLWRKAVTVRKPPLLMLPAPEEPEEMPEETPLTLALAALADQVRDEGAHAAAARLEADPAFLPGLAKVVHDSRRSTALTVWNEAIPPAGSERFDRAIRALELHFTGQLDTVLPGAPAVGHRVQPFRWVHCAPHPSGVGLPALVASVTDWRGAVAGVALLFVKPDWSGATDLEPKVVLLGDIPGNFARLGLPPTHHLAVAVSFAEAARMHWSTGGWPTWALLTVDNLASDFWIPPGITSLVIGYDPATEAAARAAARRLLRVQQRTGPQCRVRLLGPSGNVEECDEDDMQAA